MNRKDTVWIGADPGGKGNFGLAILRSDHTAQTWCLNCAEEAKELVRRELGTARPEGVGVDAPLWWSSGPSSDRQADQWLRKKYRLSGGEVQTANSLRGAAIVQGMMFVQRLREIFPAVAVTETHPNAVLKALELGVEKFFQRFSAKVSCRTKHERDKT